MDEWMDDGQTDGRTDKRTQNKTDQGSKRVPAGGDMQKHSRKVGLTVLLGSMGWPLPQRRAPHAAPVDTR